jgi:HSP20 family molecular chaperone IbpA
MSRTSRQPLKLAASRYENGCLEVRLIREVPRERAEERVR